jgi:hypothetical protein
MRTKGEVSIETWVEDTIAILNPNDHEANDAHVIAELAGPDKEDNAQHLTSLWNVTKDMTTEEAVLAIKAFNKMPHIAEMITTINEAGLSFEEAVRYIEHGPEMVDFIKFMVDRIDGPNREGAHLWYDKLTAKLEGK